MDKCIVSWRVIDRETGEVRYWCMERQTWCKDCEGWTVEQVDRLLILENQYEIQKEMHKL